MQVFYFPPKSVPYQRADMAMAHAPAILPTWEVECDRSIENSEGCSDKIHYRTTFHEYESVNADVRYLPPFHPASGFRKTRILQFNAIVNRILTRVPA
jgi:hypothetical protein